MLGDIFGTCYQRYNTNFLLSSSTVRSTNSSSNRTKRAANLHIVYLLMSHCLPRRFSKISRLPSSPTLRGLIDDKQTHCVLSLDWLESSFKISQEIRNIYSLKKIKLERLLNLENAITDFQVTFLKGMWASYLCHQENAHLKYLLRFSAR